MHRSTWICIVTQWHSLLMFVESKLIKTVVLRVVFEVFSLSHCLRSHGSSKENTKKRLETDLFRYQAQMHTKKLEENFGTRWY